MLAGSIQAPQDTSFQAMRRKLDDDSSTSCCSDPAVERSSRSPAAAARRTPARMFIALKPLDERKVTRRQVIARLRRKLAHDPGRQPLPAGGAGHPRRRPRQQRAVSVHAAGRRTSTSCKHWAPHAARAAAHAAAISTDVNTDQQNAGLEATLDDRPRHRRAARRHAAADRRHALRRLRPAAGLDDVHAAEPVPRRHGSGRRSSGSTRTRCNDDLRRAPQRQPGAAVSAFASFEPTTTPLAVNHQGQFPPITLSFNLPPGVSLGDAVDADRAAPSARSACRRRSTAASRAPRRRFRRRSTNQPLLILAALVDGLHRARHPLRELRPPAHDPLDAAVGRRRRDAGAAAAHGTDFTIIALIGIILLIGIVKKNAIMMIDFALEAERTRRPARRRRRSSRRACCASGRSLMTTMAAMLGGAAAGARHRHGLGAAPAARHRDRRRPDRQPDADAVHDAGHLPVSRSPANQEAGTCVRGLAGTSLCSSPA